MGRVKKVANALLQLGILVLLQPLQIVYRGITSIL